METQSNTHAFFAWAKQRLGEMDATLTAVEPEIAKMEGDARLKAEKILQICIDTATTLSLRRRPCAREQRRPG